MLSLGTVIASIHTTDLGSCSQVTEDAPKLPADLYEPDLCEFVAVCLDKRRDGRPQLTRTSGDGSHGPLKDHPFFLEVKSRDPASAMQWLVENALPPDGAQ